MLKKIIMIIAAREMSDVPHFKKHLKGFTTAVILAVRLTKFAESRIPSSTGWVRSKVNFHAAPFLDFLPTVGLFCLICDVKKQQQTRSES